MPSLPLTAKLHMTVERPGVAPMAATCCVMMGTSVVVTCDNLAAPGDGRSMSSSHPEVLGWVARFFDLVDTSAPVTV